MKKDNIIRYPLADIGSEHLSMTVYLHRTPAEYWTYWLGRSLQIDIADRTVILLCDIAGFEEKFNTIFSRIPRKGRFYPCVSGFSALYSSGKFFPDRKSVVNLIENAYLPCWRYAIDRVMENCSPGDSWLKTVRKMERQINNANRASDSVAETSYCPDKM